MSQKTPLPWAGWPDETGCNFAAGHLVRNIQIPITKQGRIHAETLMTAAGAIAGWGAQQSFTADSKAFSLGQEQGQIIFVTVKDGRHMMFGDAINGMLASDDPVMAQRCVWNYLAGTALAHGLQQDELPDLNNMFAHVTRELGGPGEGFPSTPQQHQPLESAGRLLSRVLPTAHACLTGEISEITKTNNFRAEQASYQIVTAWSAAQILSQCCEVLQPKIALIIGMEAAIYASKQMQPKSEDKIVEH
jgi:hypothetical protein